MIIHYNVVKRRDRILSFCIKLYDHICALRAHTTTLSQWWLEIDRTSLTRGKVCFLDRPEILNKILLLVAFANPLSWSCIVQIKSDLQVEMKHDIILHEDEVFVKLEKQSFLQHVPNGCNPRKIKTRVQKTPAGLLAKAPSMYFLSQSS